MEFLKGIRGCEACMSKTRREKTNFKKQATGTTHVEQEETKLPHNMYSQY
jgi:hypothetical protein